MLPNKIATDHQPCHLGYLKSGDAWVFGLDFVGHHFLFFDHYIESSV